MKKVLAIFVLVAALIVCVKVSIVKPIQIKTTITEQRADYTFVNAGSFMQNAIDRACSNIVVHENNIQQFKCYKKLLLVCAQATSLKFKKYQQRFCFAKPLLFAPAHIKLRVLII